MKQKTKHQLLLSYFGFIFHETVREKCIQKYITFIAEVYQTNTRLHGIQLYGFQIVSSFILSDIDFKKKSIIKPIKGKGLICIHLYNVYIIVSSWSLFQHLL